MATVENSLVIDKREAAQLTQLSVRTVERLIAAGRFPKPISIGRKRLWQRRTILEFIEANMQIAEGAA